MRIRWSETAFNELEDILAFISERNRPAAAAVARRILDRTQLLGEFPLAGHVTNESGVRALSVVTYPFVIYYAIDHVAGEVVVLNVRHTAQEP
uniref:Plasmid stabilization system n=1 Tax=Rhodopseudomonas palustris (strain BisA53) TaxID=316055 RepID=Q07V92_RHOP5